MLAFDPIAHEYRWDGAVIPHVTGIIAPLTNYDRIPRDVLERARQEGVAVHKMVELDCKNDLDLVKLPAWMAGHYSAWLRFKEESGFECFASERQVYHRRLGYGGTVDLVGRLPKMRRSKPSVIDVKRSFYAGPAIGLQTAAYLGAIQSERAFDEDIVDRYALLLNPNGTYRLQPYEDRDDHAAFLACLQQFRWKEKHYGIR